ncbi:MAG: hypothetical protein ACRCSQ_04955 [Bacteroidales bacterium]
MNVYLFNPENDTALANGDPNFVASVSARKMAADLAILPKYWMSSDDVLFDQYESSGLDEVIHCCPWGWSKEVKQRFLKKGIRESFLPTDNQLDELRMLSHRRSSIQILRNLSGINFTTSVFPELPVEIFSLNEFRTSLSGCDMGEFVLKSPWSSSGKGLCWSGQMKEVERERWVAAVLKKMGSVILETAYDRILDFAMLFHVTPEKGVVFQGYSLFKTDLRGAYEGNYLWPDSVILEELGRYISMQDLNVLQCNLIAVLNEMIPDYYTGFLGVDMMVCSVTGSDKILLHPCVEMNLRMTMGAVSRLLYDKYLISGKGLFRIVNKKKHSLLFEELSAMPFGAEAVSQGAGLTLLTPITNTSEFAAVMEKY